MDFDPRSSFPPARARGTKEEEFCEAGTQFRGAWALQNPASREGAFLSRCQPPFQRVGQGPKHLGAVPPVVLHRTSIAVRRQPAPRRFFALAMPPKALGQAQAIQRTPSQYSQSIPFPFQFPLSPINRTAPSHYAFSKTELAGERDSRPRKKSYPPLTVVPPLKSALVEVPFCCLLFPFLAFSSLLLLCAN